jgi:hypothetical protein
MIRKQYDKFSGKVGTGCCSMKEELWGKEKQRGSFEGKLKVSHKAE